MHRVRHGRLRAPALCARLRVERGEAPAPVRRRRFSDRGLVLTVYAYVMALAIVVTSLAVGLVAST